MKYMSPQVAVIFFMTSVNGDRGHVPLPPPLPRIQTCVTLILKPALNHQTSGYYVCILFQINQKAKNVLAENSHSFSWSFDVNIPRNVFRFRACLISGAIFRTEKKRITDMSGTLASHSDRIHPQCNPASDPGWSDVGGQET